MIAFHSVSKSYPLRGGERHHVFDAVDLKLPEHENIGILGANGAGKTTLLRLIAGSEKPDCGRISRAGVTISWPVGLAGGFQGSMSARENVRFVCRIHGLQLDDRRQVETFVHEFSEIGEFFDQPVKTYSSGMRARVNFALSLAFRFDVYLVDEITSVGDAAFREKATNAFLELRDRASLIYVSHNLSMLAEACDSGLVLVDGAIVYHSRIEDAIDHFRLNSVTQVA